MLPERPRQRPGLIVERAGREVLVYSAGEAAGGAIHALSPSAALIWDLCDGAHSLAEIEGAVRLAYSVAAEHDLAADLRATVAEFQAKGLLDA